MSEYVCSHCGKVFIRAWKAKFCSRECYGLSKRNREQIVCARCGKVFYDQPSDKRKFCSSECHSAFTYEQCERVVAKCDTCGKEYKTKKVEYEKSNHHYCSMVCSAEGKKKFSVMTCPVCGKEFYPEYAGRMFCSYQCRHEARRAKKIHHQCPVCKKRFWAKDWEKRKFCSDSCAKTFLVWDRHPMWSGGRSVCKEYAFVRKPKHGSRLKKNNYMCEHILIMESYLGRPLEYFGVGHPDNEIVHHIDGNKTNNKIWNLELCISRVHSKHHATLAYYGSG